MATTDTVLQEMIDEFQLRKLVHAYCRAVDRGDIAQLQTFYHHDAVDAHGGFSAGTADHFLDQLTAARPYIRSMQHNITTMNFAISGHTAEGEIYTSRSTRSPAAVETSTSWSAAVISTSTRSETTHGKSSSGRSSPTGPV